MEKTKANGRSITGIFLMQSKKRFYIKNRVQKSWTTLRACGQRVDSKKTLSTR
jgi:hypothetical protein